MLQPFAVAAEVLDTYRRYVRSSFPLRDEALDAQRERLVDDGLLWADPYVALARPGTTGPTLASLAGLLHPSTLSLPWGFDDLYAHQHVAIERLVISRHGGPASTLVLSGTGSGKTESFLIPIVDACLRSPGPGVRAVVVYPMNALANDQLKRLRALLADCPGSPTAATPATLPSSTPATASARAGLPANARWSRQAMREDPPNILLTNYSQLEYLLLRRRDAELFRFGPPSYLVVDEVHLFAGVLGAEVACLLRRLRQHTGAGPGQLCAVGTSATAGVDEVERLIAFASRFFGVPFGPDAAIAETPAAFRPPGLTIPPRPGITTGELTDAGRPEGLALLAAKALGAELAPDDTLAGALGRVIDEVATISLVEHALAAPAPLSTAAAALGQLPERAGVAGDELKREAAALILLGAAAHQGAVGEEEGEPRLRPRLHQVVRSLAGLWRCLDPGCGLLAKPGAAQCQGSGAMTLPIASCRTCGEAYWASPRGGRALPEVDRLLSIDLRRDEPRLLLDASVAERDYYHRQYLSSPRRLIVREHSGQVEGDERLALEERFNDRAHPSVDVLACTPTLEVGVSLDDLHAVVLRNLPPTPANYAQRVGRAGRRSRVALAVAHAGQAPHDSYFFDSPGELIAGEVRAPAISLDNEPLLRRHVNSLILETLGLDLPARWVPPLDADQEWGGETVADRDGVLRESALAPFAQLLDRPEVRSELKAGVRGAFASAYDPAPPAHSELICAQQLSQFLPDLRAALNRWCDRYRALLDEFAALRRGLGVPSKADQDLEGRLRRELEGLAGQKTPEHQPLGFLGLVGFLPRYGFTGSSVLLHPPLADALLVQRAWVAVTEFAPDNIVYARGHKIKVRRLHPAPVPESSAEPDHRDNVLREARRCDDCEVLVFDPLVKACPGCGQDLVGQRVVELTGVRGAGAAISSEDEYRTRADYDVVHCLGETSQAPEVKTVGGLTFERTSGREIVLANRGLAPAGGGRAPGFSICTGCGYAAETRPTSTTDGGDGDPDEAAERGHSPRCPGRKDPSGEVVRSGVWLTATIRGDAMELKLPAATRGPELTAWRTTLAEALLLGIRETMQAGARDLGWFIRPLGAEPQAIVCYDTMPGGTGYLPKLFTDGGAGLRAAADEALARLGSCDCGGSCHRCLRDFWNQRHHHLLDRFQVLGTLRRLAGAVPTSLEEAEDDRLESFLEQEFFERLGTAGLPLPTLQVVRELRGGRITRVDAEYRDPDVSVYLDGRAYHAMSAERVAADLDRRNQLEAEGVLVLEFTYADVMEHFADTVEPALRRALAGERDDPGPEPDRLAGIVVVAQDDQRRHLEVTVDPEAWVASETARACSLASANRLRLAGWRLRRVASR